MLKSLSNHSLRRSALALALGWLASSGVRAEEATPVDSRAPEEITITAQRGANADIRVIPSSISVIDAGTIDAQLAIALDPLDLLDVAIPGMTPNTDSKGSSCTSNLRGRDVAFLINGVPITQNLQVGSCSDAYNLSPFAIDRIEVSRGTSAVFGYGAPGGIINLVTRRASSETLAVDLRARTSFDTSEVDDSWHHEWYAGAGRRAGRFELYAGVGYANEDLRRDPTGQILTNQALAEAWGIDATLGFRVSDDGELSASFVWFREDRGDYYGPGEDIFTDDGEPYDGPVVNFPHPSEEEAFHRNFVGALSYRDADVFGSALDLTFYLQDQHEDGRPTFFFGGAPFYDASFFDNDRWGIRSSLETPLGAWDGEREASLGYGVDFVSNTYYGPGLDPYDTSTITVFFSPEVRLQTLSGFAQLEAPLGRFRLTGGVRYEHYFGKIGDRGDEVGFAPGDGGWAQPGAIPEFSLTLLNGGLLYELTPVAQLFVSVSQGAQITEFGRAARNTIDPDQVNLEPAKATQYELGARYAGERLGASFAAFFSESKLSTGTQPDPGCTLPQGCPVIPLRQPEKYWGVEATLDFAASERVRVGGAFTYQDGEFEDVATGEEQRVSGAQVSPVRVAAYAEAAIWESLRARLAGTYVADRDPYREDEQDFFLGLINTESYFVADASLTYEAAFGAFTLAASNLFDEKYVISSNAGNFGFFDIRAEGRRLSLTYTAHFE
jgi:iron complex outermembrane receptor protein